MPAVSIAQQNFFKLVNAYKKGGLKKSEVSKDIVATAKSLTKKDIEDYLKVKKNAPDKVESKSMDTSPSSNTDITVDDALEFLAYIDRSIYKQRMYIQMN